MSLLKKQENILNALVQLFIGNITYKDRLTRFGFEYFENIFQKFSIKIVVI